MNRAGYFKDKEIQTISAFPQFLTCSVCNVRPRPCYSSSTSPIQVRYIVICQSKTHSLFNISSYQTDPQYQLKFTIAWASVLGFFVLRSSPRVVQAVKRGRGSYSPNSWLGIKEETFCRHDTDGSLTRGASKIDQLLVFQSFWKGTFGRLNGSLHLVIPSINLDLGQSE